MHRATSTAVVKSSVTPNTWSPSSEASTNRCVMLNKVTSSMRSNTQCSFSIRTRDGTSTLGPICCPIRCVRVVREARSRTGFHRRRRSGMLIFRCSSTPARNALAIRVPSLKSEDFIRSFLNLAITSATKEAFRQRFQPLTKPSTETAGHAKQGWRRATTANWTTTRHGR